MRSWWLGGLSRRAGALVAVAMLGTGLTGCSGGRSGPPASSSPGSSASSPAGSSAGSSAGATAGASAGAGGATGPAAGAESGPQSARTPVDATIGLQALLGEHAVLALDMMRARIRGDADLAQAADAAIGKNTAAMGVLLRPVIGGAGVSRFEDLWGRHVQALFNYSRGVAVGDATVRDQARAELVRDENLLAQFFVAGSHGRLDPSAASAGVRMHVDHLLQAADAYAAKDYRTAAQLYRQSYAHTFDLGGALAGALLPASAAPALHQPTVQLRTALTKLFGEHVALLIAGMRSSAGDADDFRAVGTALNGNTVDLTSAVDSLFGDRAAQGFQRLWADHVDALMEYARAGLADDAQAQARARAGLHGFESSFPTFVSGATQGRLSTPALAQAIVKHDEMLVDTIDAYRSGNYPLSHDLGDHTYSDMYTLAGQLSQAIGATLAARLPRGGSQTGGGGTARTVVGR